MYNFFYRLCNFKKIKNYINYFIIKYPVIIPRICFFYISNNYLYNNNSSYSFKFYLNLFICFKKLYACNPYFLFLFINFINSRILLNKFYSKNNFFYIILATSFIYFNILTPVYLYHKNECTKIIKNIKIIKNTKIFNNFKIYFIFNNFKNKINFFYFNIFNKVNLKQFLFIKQFFLRKTKCFNKSRYSRNRQTYRTGFYWCIYVNIIALLGLNFLFYKFIINFTTLWYLFYFFIFLFFFSKFFKYNFQIYYNFYNELKGFLIFIFKFLNYENSLFL